MTALVVRWGHVLGMAVAVGGATLAWWLLRGPLDGAAAGRVAEAYEWLFWGALGLLVMTGVGNLGALAPAVPGPDTRWGVVLAGKLLLVVGFLVGSLVRTLVVRRADPSASRHVAVMRRGYAVTALVLVGVLALAEVLAHG
ncbi:CopD family protein [Halobacteriaceae archaeon GCM10025711]